MATIAFYAGENFTISNLSGSGLGFYGSSFGRSVAIGSFQTRTYVTDSTGVTQAQEVDNIRWFSSSSAILGSAGVEGSAILLTAIPNYQATLNIRFTHTSAVKVANASYTIFDRSSLSNAPSGLVCKCAEIIHPGVTQVNNGSGDTTWFTASGSPVSVPLVDSPGTSGTSPSGSNTTDTQHDWFTAISASPLSVGSKTAFGLSVSVEYL